MDYLRSLVGVLVRGLGGRRPAAVAAAAAAPREARTR